MTAKIPLTFFGDDEQSSINALKRKRQLKAKNFEKSSKLLSDMVKEVQFKVNSVTDVGYCLKLDVTPKLDYLSTNQLHFYGTTDVKPGSKIIAKIPFYTITTSRQISSEGNEKPLYFPRNSSAKEAPIELRVLNWRGKVIDVDRSVDYDLFK